MKLDNQLNLSPIEAPIVGEIWDLFSDGTFLYLIDDNHLKSYRENGELIFEQEAFSQKAFYLGYQLRPDGFFLSSQTHEGKLAYLNIDFYPKGKQEKVNYLKVTLPRYANACIYVIPKAD